MPYKGKYLISGSARTDGSSRFGLKTAVMGFSLPVHWAGWCLKKNF
jgi:hypothetical protein